MSQTNDNNHKDSEIQAAEGLPDPELDSLIAPQGYDPDLVDEVAMLETPAQQRNKAIRFGIIVILLFLASLWVCVPANQPQPEDLYDPAPYDIHSRPALPTDKFLDAVVPKKVGSFNLKGKLEEQSFNPPYVGATVVRAYYTNEADNLVIVEMIQTGSYINARRYLENYKELLNSQADVTAWKERFYIDKNYIQWSAPGFGNQSYGLAWNNETHFISVTSAISSAQSELASEFPY